MTLDNTAKIGDIITALEGMQAINQKAELASVIGSPATATDNIATQITKIQDAKNVIATKTGQDNTLPLLEMANGIVTGKKWASGIVTSSSTNETFQNATNTNSESRPFVDVTGFNFKPSTIILTKSDASTHNVVFSDNFKYNASTPYVQVNPNGVLALVRTNAGAAIITEGRFKIPATANDVIYNWIAFE